ncbi:hypothetical protein ACOY1M_004422, partial [Escherichia coli]
MYSLLFLVLSGDYSLLPVEKIKVNPVTVPGFLLPSPHHTPFKKPPQPRFSYRYAMQVTK